MCHPKIPKNVNTQDSNIPDDLPEITDIASHNDPNVHGHIVTINGQEVIYFMLEEAYEQWINTEEVYSQN